MTAISQDFQPVKKGELEALIQGLPKEFHLIRDYLRDPDTGWKRHKGNLRIDHSFNNTDALIVEGNLIIKGNYDDYSGGIGMLVVLGNMSADNVISWGSIAVTGKLQVSGLVYAYYNDFTFEAGEVAARALVVYDKSNFIGKNSSAFYLSSDNSQDEADVSRTLRMFVPEVVIPEIQNMDGDLSYIYPDFDACQQILAENRNVFREKEGEPELLQHVQEMLSPGISEERISILIEKDPLLKLASVLKEDLPPAIQDRLFMDGDPQVMKLLGKHPQLSGDLLKKIAASEAPELRAIVLGQSKLPRDLAVALSRDPDAANRLAVVQRGHLGQLSPAEADRLLNDPSAEVRAAVITHNGTTLSVEQATRVSEDVDGRVRMALAQYLSAEALWQRYPALPSGDRERLAMRLLNDPETASAVLHALSVSQQEELIARSSKADRSRLLYELARTTKSLELQNEIAGGEVQELKKELAQNLSLFTEVQRKLIQQLGQASARKRLSLFDYDARTQAMDGPEGVIDQLLGNPNASPDVVTRAAQYCAETRGNAIFCSALTHRKDLSAEVLEILRKAYSGEDAEDLALTMLLQKAARREQVVWAITRWHDDDEDLLEELQSLQRKKDPEFWSGLSMARADKLREVAATNANTPPERLAELLKDRVEDVKMAASANPSLPGAVLESIPEHAPLWSVTNPNISEQKIKAIYDWAMDRGEASLAGYCLEQLAARRLRTGAS